jgi:hypothetical protein
MRSMLVLALVGAAGVASAQPADDGYCEHVEGVADATSAIQLAPSLEGHFGYIEQSPTSVTPDASTTNLRLIAGMRYRLTGIYEGLATRAHGDADCRRHRALERVRGETMARALAAKARVIDDALGEAEKILALTAADAEARRTTAQEATATRLRVDELHGLAAEAHRELSALPTPTAEPLGAALTAYHRADAEMEDAEATLRRAQGLDLSVRAGIDDFLTGPNALQYYAVVSVGVNLGLLWQGRGNDRAAAGRKRLVMSGHDPLGVDATLERVETEIVVETKRAEQVAALVGDLELQLESLGKLAGEDARRYRQTVWFDAVKARAEAAYLAAHLASLHEVLAK